MMKVPSFDVLRLMQPDAYLVALRSVSESYKSDTAVAGAKMVETLCGADQLSMAVDGQGASPVLPV